MIRQLPIASQITLLKEAVRSGTIASIVMMPFGFLFKALDLRVGHYGPKLGEFLFGLRPEPWMQVLLLVKHLVIGWLSAVPLLLFWRWTSPRSPSLADGLLYGALYYLAVNALALPAIFGDALPWQLGWSYIYPSLVVHLVFGLSLAVTARAFGWAHPGVTFGRTNAEPRRLGDFYLDEIDVAVANDFLRTRVKTHKASTVKRELGDLQTIWARLKHLDPAAAKRLPAENPWKEAEQAIIKASGEKRERHLSDEEEFQLLVELAACRNKDMPCIVGLALATGMRRGEVLMLEWGQINEAEGYLRLAPSQTKADRSRYVALTPEAKSWIADKRERLGTRNPKAGERLFAYTVDGFKSVWNRVVARAKVENLRFHDTRRTAITEMLRKMANPSPVAVKRLTGMQSVEHIEREFVIPFEERKRASEGRFNSEKDIRSNVGHSDARMTDHYANLSELGTADEA